MSIVKILVLYFINSKKVLKMFMGVNNQPNIRLETKSCRIL